jgi:hypothetical protein
MQLLIHQPRVDAVDRPHILADTASLHRSQMQLVLCQRSIMQTKLASSSGLTRGHRRQRPISKGA